MKHWFLWCMLVSALPGHGRDVLSIIIAPTSLRTKEPVQDVRLHMVSGGLEIEAPGFLPRRMPWSIGSQTMWPSDELMPTEFTFEGAHGSRSDLPIQRPARGVMTVEASLDLLANVAARDALFFAIANINSEYREQEFSFQLVPPESGGQVYVYRNKFDPVWTLPGYENAGALAYVYADRSSVVLGGRIMFIDFGDVFYGGHLRKAMSHELGHMAGIRGHPRGIPGVASDGVMASSSEFAQRFTGPEGDLLRWLFQRSPGTRWPDDSIHVSSTAHTADRQPVVVTAACRMTPPQ